MLRGGDPRDGRQGCSARGQMQECAAGKSHFEPPSRFTSFDHLVGAGQQHRFVSLTRSSMLLDCLAIAVSVLLSAGIRNAWAITLGSSPAQGRLVASYLTELVLQIAHLHPNVPGWENGRNISSGARS